MNFPLVTAWDRGVNLQADKGYRGLKRENIRRIDIKVLPTLNKSNHTIALSVRAS